MTSSTKESIVLRDIETIEEFRAVEDLQVEAWGDNERDVVPLNQLVGARCVGGSLIGAFDGKRLVGFAYGFYGHLSGRIVHHSHMLAVSNAYRNHNLGFRLKAAQRERVLADRITERITWTFDPLQSLNAYFNFEKLGVVSDTYKVNVYGENGASFLHRNGTDRLFVTWLLDSPKVNELMHPRKTHRRDQTAHGRKGVLLLRNSDSGPEYEASIGDARTANFVAIEIPADINSVEQRDFEMAREWRQTTRRAFSEALSEGFVVIDYFRKDVRTGFYLLKKTDLDKAAG